MEVCFEWGARCGELDLSIINGSPIVMREGMGAARQNGDEGKNALDDDEPTR